MARVVKGLCYLEGELLFLKRRDGVIDLPGGRMRELEKEHETLKREVYEETNLYASSIEGPLNEYNSHKGPLGKTIVTIVIYACKVGSKHAKLSNEHESFAWVPVSEATNYDIDEGTIRAIAGKWF